MSKPNLDEMMEDLAQTETSIEALKASTDERIHAIKSEFKDAAKPLQKKARALKGRIQRFALKRYDRGESSHKTPFGTVNAAKTPPKLEVEDEARTLQLLHTKGRGEYVRRYEEPDLEAMAGETDDFLHSVGIHRSQKVKVHIRVEKTRAPSGS